MITINNHNHNHNNIVCNTRNISSSDVRVEPSTTDSIDMNHRVKYTSKRVSKQRNYKDKK